LALPDNAIMRSLSQSYTALQGHEQPPLQFRNVALLYPSKQVLERVRSRGGDEHAPVQHSIDAMFDEDETTNSSPIATNDEIRVIVAQDDAGPSHDRVLFDSHENNTPTTTAAQQNAKIMSFNRSLSPPEPLRGSAFIRRQLKDSQPHPAPSSSSSAFFGARRTPTYASLADARNEPPVPTENSREEMDSWLDCVFGKTQMAYKGDNTKLHVLQRQPPDPVLAHWERESRRGGFELCPQRNGPLPSLRPDELVGLRKPALLVSRTFAVPLHNEDLPEKLRQKIALEPYSTNNKSDINRTKTLPKIHCNTPLIGLAILLPLKKTQDDADAASSPLQLAMANWHSIVRALDALEASAALDVQAQLNIELEALAKRHGKGLPMSMPKIRLRPSAFQELRHFGELSDHVSARIARSFRALDVSVRSEWNIWRDELRDWSRLEKGFDPTKIYFLQLALTAALTSNLSWMRLFAPPQLQTRLQREAQALEDKYDEAQSRVVVTTADHNTARQIIYLLAKFSPSAQPTAQFARSPAATKAHGRVSALTQGLQAAKKPTVPKFEDRVPHGPTISLGAPVFNFPIQSSPSTSPVKHVGLSRDRTPSKSSLQRMKSRIDIQGKGTPAMPIASAPGSSWTTPAASPDARPSSSASASGNLMRHLQSNNSALSETSTESGSFWNSLRSSSWNWGVRRESGATSASEGGLGVSASQRGDAPIGILKNGKTSLGRSGGKKLVRMVEETEELRAQRSIDEGRKDSGLPTPTIQPTMKEPAPPMFAQMLEYTYDATTGVVDVKQLGGPSSTKNCKVPFSGNHFPNKRGHDFSLLDAQAHLSPRSGAVYDRVAGYLDRLHPDFALQAVKPYQGLEGDVKTAMRGERSPKHDLVTSEPQFFPLERWVEVCSTIVINADTMTVKRLTLRRHVRYTLTTPEGMPGTTAPKVSANAIKVTKSEEMDSVKRTYRRNDAGSKVDWKDKRVVLSETDGSSGSGTNSMTSSCEQMPVGSTGTAFKFSTLSDLAKPKPVAVGSTGTAFKHPTSVEDSNTVIPGHSDSLSTTDDLKAALDKHAKGNTAVGDDLTVFIDENARVTNKAKIQAPVTATRRAPLRDVEGKITGWKEIDENELDEPGLHDLPADFVKPRRPKSQPVIHERTLKEAFEEENITRPDQSIVSLLEQMFASSETRSAAPSRASSMHERTHSRSNSICGSGLAELQLESKKIVEDTLEDLVTSVASDGELPNRPSGSFFRFRRGGQGSLEASVLRQAVSKWFTEG